MEIERKYGAITTLVFPLIDFGATDFEATPVTFATGDVKIIKDEGAAANTTNLPAHEGNGIYSLALTATEMEAARIVIVIVDQTATKLWEDQGLLVTTYGHASAQHAFDRDSAGVDVTSISGDSTAADNLEATYDGTGYTDPNAPAKQSQLDTIANTGGATWKAASAFVLTTGSQDANTYAETEALDEVYHTLSDAAGTLDAYYEFDIGATGVPSSINLEAYLTNSNDTVQVYAYNFTLTSWVQVGEIVGKNQTTRETFNFKIPSSLVGSNGDVGKVRVRVHGTGLTTASFNLDQGLLGYNPIYASATGYANGAIWLDTVNGFAGTVSDVHGVADHPSDNWADALTLLAAKKFTRIEIANGSSVTLTSATEGLLLNGSSWTLALGGQSVSNSTIIGATMSGTATGTGAKFVGCFINTATLPPCCYQQCKLNIGVTLNGAGDYIFDYCSSNVAGGGTPYWDFGVTATHNVSIRHYSGGAEFRNMGALDAVSYEGKGQYILAASCTGGSFNPRGIFKPTDNSGGAVTVVAEALINRSGINDYLENDASHGAGAWTATGQVGARTVTIHSQTSGAVTIPFAKISVYDAANTTFITSCETDSGGDCEISIDDGTYSIRPWKQGYSFTTPQSIVVTADATHNITGTAQTITPADDPNICRIHSSIADAGGNAQGTAFAAYYVVPGVAQGIVGHNAEVLGTIVDGDMVLGLIRDAVVEITAPGMGYARTRFTVPDLATQDLATWTPDP